MRNEEYYIWYNSCDKLRMRYPSETVIGFLKNNLSGGRVLDLGCGSGRHVIAAAELGYEAHGLDISPEGLEHCAEVAKLRGLTVSLTAAGMKETGYPDGHFDAVFCISAINGNSYDDQVEILAEVERILAPGGILLVSFYGKKDFSYALAKEHGRPLGKETYVIPGELFHSFTSDGKESPDYLASFSDTESIDELLKAFSLVRQYEIYQPYGNANLNDDARASHLLYAIARK